MNSIQPHEAAFIEPAWQEALLSLLIAINGALGRADLTSPLRPLTRPDVLVIAQGLEQRSYTPENWFGVAARTLPARPPVAAEAPTLQPSQAYAVIHYAAEPSDRTEVSRRSGGLLFEDPFYAALAAYNAGRGSLAMEVKASSREQAWARRRDIVDAIRAGTYNADGCFAERGPLLAGDRREGAWSSGGLPGPDLERLIFNGRASVSFDGKPPQLHGLYKYVAP